MNNNKKQRLILQDPEIDFSVPMEMDSRFQNKLKRQNKKEKKCTMFDTVFQKIKKLDYNFMITPTLNT